MLNFKPAFSFSSFTLIKRLFSSSLISGIRVASSARRSNPRLRPGAVMRGVTLRPRSGVAAGRRYLMPLSPRPRAVVGKSNRTTEARGHGREDQPLFQGAVAVWVQEGLEELSHSEGQEGWQ